MKCQQKTVNNKQDDQHDQLGYSSIINMINKIISIWFSKLSKNSIKLFWMAKNSGSINNFIKSC